MSIVNSDSNSTVDMVKWANELKKSDCLYLLVDNNKLESITWTQLKKDISFALLSVSNQKKEKLFALTEKFLQIKHTIDYNNIKDSYEYIKYFTEIIVMACTLSTDSQYSLMAQLDAIGYFNAMINVGSVIIDKDIMLISYLNPIKYYEIFLRLQKKTDKYNENIEDDVEKVLYKNVYNLYAHRYLLQYRVFNKSIYFIHESSESGEWIQAHNMKSLQSIRTVDIYRLYEKFKYSTEDIINLDGNNDNLEFTNKICICGDIDYGQLNTTRLITKKSLENLVNDSSDKIKKITLTITIIGRKLNYEKLGAEKVLINNENNLDNEKSIDTGVIVKYDFMEQSEYGNFINLNTFMKLQKLVTDFDTILLLDNKWLYGENETALVRNASVYLDSILGKILSNTFESINKRVYNEFYSKEEDYNFVSWPSLFERLFAMQINGFASENSMQKININYIKNETIDTVINVFSNYIQINKDKKKNIYLYTFNNNKFRFIKYVNCSKSFYKDNQLNDYQINTMIRNEFNRNNGMIILQLTNFDMKTKINEGKNAIKFNAWHFLRMFLNIDESYDKAIYKNLIKYYDNTNKKISMDEIIYCLINMDFELNYYTLESNYLSLILKTNNKPIKCIQNVISQLLIKIFNKNTDYMNNYLYIELFRKCIHDLMVSRSNNLSDLIFSQLFNKSYTDIAIKYIESDVDDSVFKRENYSFMSLQEKYLYVYILDILLKESINFNDRAILERLSNFSEKYIVVKLKNIVLEIENNDVFHKNKGRNIILHNAKRLIGTFS